MRGHWPLTQSETILFIAAVMLMTGGFVLIVGRLSTQTNISGNTGHNSRLRVEGCDLLHRLRRRRGPQCAGVQRRNTMDRRTRRIPTWLTVDMTIIAASIIIIAAAMWIGFEGFGFALP